MNPRRWPRTIPSSRGKARHRPIPLGLPGARVCDPQHARTQVHIEIIQRPSRLRICCDSQSRAPHQFAALPSRDRAGLIGQPLLASRRTSLPPISQSSPTPIATSISGQKRGALPVADRSRSSPSSNPLPGPQRACRAGVGQRRDRSFIPQSVPLQHARPRLQRPHRESHLRACAVGRRLKLVHFAPRR